jgi:hypothetical protein
MGWDLDAYPDRLTTTVARRGPDRGEEFLTISGCCLTCGYDTENLCWRHVAARYDVAQITNRDSPETFP